MFPRSIPGGLFLACYVTGNLRQGDILAADGLAEVIDVLVGSLPEAISLADGFAKMANMDHHWGGCVE